ncbi:Putative peptidoglycan binding domain-containing protein [Streptomyces sp. TLI_053]|uniref:peptidoglycan-binding domain-containing protein n=1 Tax=Streptomyces sp. TLI_053 TaxID=1855352 RepID=UPI00087A5A29|nr:peptidoglycan-binding domain-containing protein [Streptomyces sp. TLI_053]SDT83480.1 Putative peptidoglycan binding domain-containing protein [Streptomyces sp. TLI_053]
MRSSSMTRSLVSFAIVAGIVVGGPSVAAFATPAPADRQAAGAQAGARLTTVENLGLNASQAEYLQDWLARYWGYPGEINGLLDTESWKAFQRFLQTYWSYTGPIDGAVSTETIKALQRRLKAEESYNGPIDGIAGPSTREAFKRFATPKD